MISVMVLKLLIVTVRVLPLGGRPLDIHSCLQNLRLCCQFAKLSLVYRPIMRCNKNQPVEEFICSSCKSRMQIEDNEANESSNLQLVAIDASESANKLKKQVPKAVEKVLAGAIRMLLFCEYLFVII